MVANIIRKSTRMNSLPEPKASNLRLFSLLFIHDKSLRFTINSIRSDKFPDMVLTHMLERTAVEFFIARILRSNNLRTVPGPIVVFLSLSAVHMSDIVRVVFLELV